MNSTVIFQILLKLTNQNNIFKWVNATNSANSRKQWKIIFSGRKKDGKMTKKKLENISLS